MEEELNLKKLNQKLSKEKNITRKIKTRYEGKWK